MKVLFCAYRDWALAVSNSVNIPGDRMIICDHKLLDDTVKTFNPDLIFFIGWSWIVSDTIIDSYTCLCIHPSKLPKYRGGSPIQNQIIDGITTSAVTLFKMNHKLDAGNIISQKDLSLEGELDEILNKISEVSISLINDLILEFKYNKKILSYEQDESKATFCKRRNPKDSEITLHDLNTCTANQIYNKIRCLQDPYPTAYITLGNGDRLYILKAKV